MSQKATVWILGDQLLLEHPALKQAETIYGKQNLCVLLIESRQRTGRHPYQRKKLVLLFSGMRHYAAALQAQGYRVDYQQADNFRHALQTHQQKWAMETLYTMSASEYRGRQFQEKYLADFLGVRVELLPNTQFLLGQHHPYPEAKPDKRYVMEYFYRNMRQHFGLLMDGDKPEGGEWNFDKENRKPLPKKESPPAIISFEPDAITQMVMAEVAELDRAVGQVEGFNLAVTHEQAQVACDDFFAHRLGKFGPYEDAMSQQHPHIYHSMLSPYLNLGLLEPLDLAQRAERAYRDGQAPINSVEGFIRQIIGWREYIHWQYWRLMPDLYEANAWQANGPMPEFFWTGQTDMNCLKQVIRRAIDSGYNHHIERLMVICNFCLLAGVNPAAVNDWFLSLYIDAYEWVMLPNVIGMGLNADGGQTATKPYIASANYINKMSDYCSGCRYSHKARTGDNACPFNVLYWNFLLTHETTLRSNPRAGRNVLGLRHLDEVERKQVQAQAIEFLDDL